MVLGQRYDAAGGCLEPTSSIGIVSGSDPGLGCTRTPTCVVTPSGVLYVSTECASPGGPEDAGASFPSLDDTSGTDPACADALAALMNMVICGGGAGDDGGDDATDAATEGAPEAADAPGGDSQEDQEAQEGGLDGG